PMRSFLFSAALIVIASSSAHATEALIFNGSGYNIQIMVGYEDDPVVAQVLFTPPGGKDWIVLPTEGLQIEKFDIEKTILTMRLQTKKHPDLPGSFSFLSKTPRLSSPLAAKKLRVNSIGRFDAIMWYRLKRTYLISRFLRLINTRL